MLDATIGPNGASVYLVVEPSPVIGMDIVEIVQEFDPLARVFLFQRVEDADIWVDDRRLVGTALIGLPEDEFRQTDIAGRMAAAGWRIVMTGAGQDPAPVSDWNRIERPFDSDALKAVLGRLGPVSRHFM